VGEELSRLVGGSCGTGSASDSASASSCFCLAFLAFFFDWDFELPTDGVELVGLVGFSSTTRDCESTGATVFSFEFTWTLCGWDCGGGGGGGGEGDGDGGGFILTLVTGELLGL